MEKTMTPKDIVDNLNTIVGLRGYDGDYELNSCTIWKHKKTGNYYYTAELLDINSGRSVVHCQLDDVILKEGE